MHESRLLDIISLADLQQLQDAFSNAAGVASIITNTHGDPVTRPSNFSEFCLLMRGHETSGGTCADSNKFLGSRAFEAGGPVFGGCLNLGLAGVSAPIILEGRHVANWFIGQSAAGRVTDDEVREFCREHGLSYDKVLTAYHKVPVLSEKDLSKALKLLEVFASFVSDICHKNIMFRKAAEEKSRAISVLQTVLGNLDTMVYVNDPRTHEMVYANETLCVQFGVDDVRGRLCYELLQGRSEPCPFCRVGKLYQADGSPSFDPISWEHRNDQLGRDFFVTDRLITWHDGRLLHMEVATDITERKALHMAEAANRAQREFLARMSHELRTPMNGVLGMTHLALSADPPQRQREYLQKIESSASLLLGIINDILDFSRIEAGKMELERQTLDLKELIANVIELIMPRAREKGLDLVTELDPGLPDYARGDGLRLSQVLLNLLGNAVKFTRSGSVTLAVSASPLGGGKLRVDCAVRDTGVGLTPEQQNLLFKPFTQADTSISRKFGGTGLGLSISRALVELMGGSISLQSVVGRGTEFSFFVELEVQNAYEAKREKAASGKEKPEKPLRGKRILLVEDNPINREIGEAVLASLGGEVHTAENGAAGVEAFLQNEYDLVFMDVRMPVMDGYEATRRIRASAKPGAGSVPIIAMTANAMLEDQDLSAAAGMNGHIAKPIDIEKLKECIMACLAGRA